MFEWNDPKLESLLCPVFSSSPLHSVDVIKFAKGGRILVTLSITTGQLCYWALSLHRKELIPTSLSILLNSSENPLFFASFDVVSGSLGEEWVVSVTPSGLAGIWSMVDGTLISTLSLNAVVTSTHEATTPTRCHVVNLGDGLCAIYGPFSVDLLIIDAPRATVVNRLRTHLEEGILALCAGPCAGVHGLYALVGNGHFLHWTRESVCKAAVLANFLSQVDLFGRGAWSSSTTMICSEDTRWLALVTPRSAQVFGIGATLVPAASLSSPKEDDGGWRGAAFLCTSSTLLLWTPGLPPAHQPPLPTHPTPPPPPSGTFYRHDLQAPLPGVVLPVRMGAAGPGPLGASEAPGVNRPPGLLASLHEALATALPPPASPPLAKRALSMGGALPGTPTTPRTSAAAHPAEARPSASPQQPQAAGRPRMTPPPPRVEPVEVPLAGCPAAPALARCAAHLRGLTHREGEVLVLAAETGHLSVFASDPHLSPAASSGPTREPWSLRFVFGISLRECFFPASAGGPSGGTAPQADLGQPLTVAVMAPQGAGGSLTLVHGYAGGHLRFLMLPAPAPPGLTASPLAPAGTPPIRQALAETRRGSPPVYTFLRAHGGPVRCLLQPAAWPHLLLSGGDDGCVRVWRLGSPGQGPQCVRVLAVHCSPVRCLLDPAGLLVPGCGASEYGHPEADWVLSVGDRDGTLCVLDMATLRCRHVWAGHPPGLGYQIRWSVPFQVALVSWGGAAPGNDGKDGKATSELAGIALTVCAWRVLLAGQVGSGAMDRFVCGEALLDLVGQLTSRRPRVGAPWSYPPPPLAPPRPRPTTLATPLRGTIWHMDAAPDRALPPAARVLGAATPPGRPGDGGAALGMAGVGVLAVDEMCRLLETAQYARSAPVRVAALETWGIDEALDSHMAGQWGIGRPAPGFCFALERLTTSPGPPHLPPCIGVWPRRTEAQHDGTPAPSPDMSDSAQLVTPWDAAGAEGQVIGRTVYTPAACHGAHRALLGALPVLLAMAMGGILMGLHRLQDGPLCDLVRRMTGGLLPADPLNMAGMPPPGALIALTPTPLEPALLASHLRSPVESIRQAVFVLFDVACVRLSPPDRNALAQQWVAAAGGFERGPLTGEQATALQVLTILGMRDSFCVPLSAITRMAHGLLALAQRHTDEDAMLALHLLDVALLLWRPSRPRSWGSFARQPTHPPLVGWRVGGWWAVGGRLVGWRVGGWWAVGMPADLPETAALAQSLVTLAAQQSLMPPATSYSALSLLPQPPPAPGPPEGLPLAAPRPCSPATATPPAPSRVSSDEDWSRLDFDGAVLEAGASPCLAGPPPLAGFPDQAQPPSGSPPLLGARWRPPTDGSATSTPPRRVPPPTPPPSRIPEGGPLPIPQPQPQPLSGSLAESLGPLVSPLASSTSSPPAAFVAPHSPPRSESPQAPFHRQASTPSLEAPQAPRLHRQMSSPATQPLAPDPEGAATPEGSPPPPSLISLVDSPLSGPAAPPSAPLPTQEALPPAAGLTRQGGRRARLVRMTNRGAARVVHGALRLLVHLALLEPQNVFGWMTERLSRQLLPTDLLSAALAVRAVTKWLRKARPAPFASPTMQHLPCLLRLLLRCKSPAVASSIRMGLAPYVRDATEALGASVVPARQFVLLGWRVLGRCYSCRKNITGPIDQTFFPLDSSRPAKRRFPLVSIGMTMAAVGTFESHVEVYQTASPAHRRVLEGHGGPIVAVQLSPSEDLLATYSEDATFRLWRPGAAVVPAKDKKGSFFGTEGLCQQVLPVSPWRDGMLNFERYRAVRIVWDGDASVTLHRPGESPVTLRVAT
ncbi:hypothetical protein PAPYR_357 [Paratrimastix pyriformis]|uniref:Uncharacterized protein n=1 Tax=Paratrimastix pyriformis TaxID=342808 RepID=A0ABQ8UVG8_9EUKA|nr:hypothetical protein PAPYR_357 [Paratrimastix pyriformis]